MMRWVACLAIVLQMACSGAWKLVRVTSHLEQVQGCELVIPGLGLTGEVVPQKKAQKLAAKHGADTILIQRSTDDGIAGDGYLCDNPSF